MKYLLLLTFLFSDTALGLMLAPRGEIKVYKDPTNKSDAIGTVKDAVEGDERVGMFFKLKAGGYVSALEVRPSSSGGLKDRLKEIIKEGQPPEEPRQRSLAMGVRGLDEEDLSGACRVRPNLRAVFRMEDRKEPKSLDDAILIELSK